MVLACCCVLLIQNHPQRWLSDCQACGQTLASVCERLLGLYCTREGSCFGVIVSHLR